MAKIPLSKQYPPAPPVPTTGTLGHRFGETVARAIVRARDMITEWLEDRLINFAVDILERIESDLAPLMRPLVNQVRQVPGMPDAIKALLDEVANPAHQGVGALMGGLASTTASAGLGTVLNAAFASWGYEANRYFNPARIDLQSALVLMWRFPAIAQRVMSDLQDQGLTAQRITDLYNLVRTYPDPASIQEAIRRGLISEDYGRELIRQQGQIPEDAALMVRLRDNLMPANVLQQAYLRGLITAQSHDEQMQKLGFSAGQVATLKNLYQIIPPVQDLITMAVREAFSPEQVAALQLDADFPAEFGAWAQKQGLSSDWAHKYWQAHWQLPSPQMGYEMLQRGIIARPELANLLRALDYSPAWRDKLIQLSYKPYTRVDIRRMYQTGILTAEQVMRSYMDIGYDEEHAANLTQFTVMGASSEEKDLTKADILGGYKDGILYREDAKSFLVNLGYDNNEAEFYLVRQDLDKAAATRKERIEEIHTLYLKRVYIETQARNNLAAMGCTAIEIDSYIDKWNRELRSRQAQLTRSDVDQMYKLAMVSRDQARVMLQSLDYPWQVAEQIISMWDTEAAQAAEEQSRTKYRVPSNNEIKKLLWQGIITPARARDLLAARLYNGETINWYIQSWAIEQDELETAEQAARAKADAATIRQPTLSEIRTLWLENIIDDDTRDTLIENIGIAETVRGYYTGLWQKQLADLQAAAEAKRAAAVEIKPKALNVSQANDLYVSGIIDEAGVGVILTQQGYSATDQARLLALWQEDRARVLADSQERSARAAAIPARNLTLAQLRDMFAKQIISLDEAAAGLAQLDYSADDITALLTSWIPTTEG